MPAGTGHKTAAAIRVLSGKGSGKPFCGGKISARIKIKSFCMGALEAMRYDVNKPREDWCGIKKVHGNRVTIRFRCYRVRDVKDTRSELWKGVEQKSKGAGKDGFLINFIFHNGRKLITNLHYRYTSLKPPLKCNWVNKKCCRKKTSFRFQYAHIRCLNTKRRPE